MMARQALGSTSGFEFPFTLVNTSVIFLYRYWHLLYDLYIFLYLIELFSFHISGVSSFQPEKASHITMYNVDRLLTYTHTFGDDIYFSFILKDNF